MGKTTGYPVGRPDWEGEPLQRFAYVDETTDGFTELRVHGVSGPPPESILDYPAAVVTLVHGNATSGFWRRWRLGGSLEDVPHLHRIEAFSWGGLTSRASRQALWLLLVPFSLVNLAHWMLPPYTRGDGRDKAVSYAAVSLLRVLGLSFTVTLALAGAEVAMDLGAWQCGANPACLATLQRHDPLGRFLNDPGPRLAIAGALSLLVLLVLLLAGNARFKPLRDSDPMDSPLVSITRARPVLGDPKFWEVDHSTRWLRCLHTVAWCAATGAVASGALAALRPQGDHNPVAIALVCANLAVLAAVFGLSTWQRFGRGGKGWRRTTGYRWINLAAVGLLLASLTVTAVYMPAKPQGSHPMLPYAQGALGWLTFGQGIVLLLLAGCVGWLAWRFAHARAHADADAGATLPAEDRAASRRWGPFLGGMFAVVAVALGWLLGLSQSAGYSLWVADRLPTGQVPGADSRAALPDFFTWIDAYALATIAMIFLYAGYVACRLARRTGGETQAVLAAHPAENAEERSTFAEIQSRARAAARWKILAQSVETLPWMLLVVAGLSPLLLLPGWFLGFPDPEFIRVAASGGAWVITTGTVGLVVVAYLAFRNQSTRRIVGILWDVTTFWPRANHPLTPACSAQRAIPQLADRIAALTDEDTDFLVLSGHSQGSVLTAAAVLRLAQDDDHGGVLQRVSLLTFGSPLRRLYARGFPAYFSVPVLEEVGEQTGKRWLNLWAQTDPIGADIALGSPACTDWQMLPDPLTLDVDPRTGEPVGVCDHSGYVSRPEYPVAVEFLRGLPQGEEYTLARLDGEALDGSRGYVLHMPAGQLPGVGGAWSVTLYSDQDRLFPNALMRFSVGTSSGQLITAANGDVDLYVQASPPAQAQQPNWLPAPKGDFSVVLRVRWPPGGKPAGWIPPLLALAPSVSADIGQQ